MIDKLIYLKCLLSLQRAMYSCKKKGFETVSTNPNELLVGGQRRIVEVIS